MDKSEFIIRLEEGLKTDLPGIDAHQIMSPISRPLDINTILDISAYRASSVAIIFYPGSESIQFILIQRPEYEGNHGGQISFPGGKSEFTDIDDEFTARRETLEEIGVILNDKHLLGQITDVFIPISKFIVKPFLYWLDEAPSYKLDPREVSEVFSVSLLHLLEDSKVKSTTLKLGSGITMKNVPYFDLNSKIVWGATALILSELKQILKN